MVTRIAILVPQGFKQGAPGLSVYIKPQLIFIKCTIFRVLNKKTTRLFGLLVFQQKKKYHPYELDDTFSFGQTVRKVRKTAVSGNKNRVGNVTIICQSMI
jgi:hypothetical protein